MSTLENTEGMDLCPSVLRPLGNAALPHAPSSLAVHLHALRVWVFAKPVLLVGSNAQLSGD